MGKASNNIIKLIALFAIITSYGLTESHSIASAANNQIKGGLNAAHKDYYESGKKVGFSAL